VRIRTWRLVTLLFASLTLGMAFSHLLEMSPKLHFEAALWVTLQQRLYRAFGTIGAVIEVGALLLACGLSFLLRRHKAAFVLTLVGMICLALALAAWAVLILPVNVEVGGWTTATIPAGWARLRDRWEYGHAARAVILLVGFAALVLSLLVDTPRDGGSK
jgi:hypothetical protein